MSFDLKLVNGDIAIKNGDLAIVEDSDKLVQDVLKMISTEIGSNPFFPAYGCIISQALIGTGQDSEFVETIASQQLRASLENLQKSQLEQLKNNQIITPQEQIAAIEDIQVSQYVNDPRSFLVKLTIISKAFQRVPVSFSLTS